MKTPFVFLSLFLVFILNLFSTEAVYDKKSHLDIKINEKYIHLEDKPFILDSTTYVPLRNFFEAVDGEVNWHSDLRCATVLLDDTLLTISTSDSKAYVNDTEKEFTGKIKMKNGRVFVPARLLSNAFLWDIDWDGHYQNVSVTTNTDVNEDMVNKKITDDNILWLGRIIEAESGGEPYLGKVAVGNVVMNRVDSRDFPNTIYDVIFDRKYGVQFQPVLNGAIYNSPSFESVQAAKASLKGHKPVGDCLYFLNPKTAESFWIINNRTYHSTIKNHDFYI